MNGVKPVSLEMELDFHERLLQTVGKNISQTKKRLHDAELVLNLRPPDHEPAEIIEWNKKVSQLIDRRNPLEFPTLYKVRKEYEQKAMIKSIRSGRQRIESDEKFNLRMSRILAREAEMIKKKVLSDSASFGRKSTGEAIRTIDGYKGGNTMHTDSRTLIVKEGSYVPHDPTASSLPAWIGPGHYPNATNRPSQEKNNKHACIPFRSQSRNATSEEVSKRNAINRRRRVINEQKQRINTGESSRSSSYNKEYIDSDTITLSSLNTGFGEGSSCLEHSSSQPLQPTALELAKQDLLGDEPELEVEVPFFKKKEYVEDDDGGLSLVSTLSYNTKNTPIHSRCSTTNKKLRKQQYNVEFHEQNNHDKLVPSETTTPRTSTSALYYQTPGKSILKSYRHSIPLPKRQAPVLNPIYTRKDLTAKLIQADERVNTSFFKVKDYTMNAFDLHSPDVVYMNEFEPEDAEGSVDPTAGVYANRMVGLPARAPKPVGQYTSEIFIVKPPEYVPNRPDKLPSEPSAAVPSSSSSSKLLEASKKNATSSSTCSTTIKTTPLTSSSPAKGTGRGMQIDTVLTPTSPGKNSAQFSPLPNPTTTTSTTATHLPLSEPSPKHKSSKAYQHAVLSKDIQADKLKSERSINKVIQRRHDSTYFQQQNKALIDEDILSNTSSPYEPNHTDTTTTSTNPLPNLPIPLTKSVLNSSNNVNNWLYSNQIIRNKSNKKLPKGEHFLKERIELPSIALSLTGLLLDENPYSPNKDEFMREYYHRSASEIGI